MRISKLRKRRWELYLIIATILLVFAVLCFFSSFYCSDFLANKILNSYLKSEDVHLSAKRCGFSFKNGIIFRRISLTNKESSISAQSFSLNKDGESTVVMIEGAAIDIALLGGKMFYEEDKISKAGSVKIGLKNVELKSRDSSLFKIEKGFILLGKNEVNWDMRMNYKFISIDSKGFVSLSNKTCLFFFDADSLSVSLMGEYDFNTQVINSKLFFKGKPYVLSTDLLFDRGSIALKDIIFEKFLIPGPINATVLGGIASNWSIQGTENVSRGDFGFEDKENHLKFYLRVLKAHLGNYELITNLYLDYVKTERALSFHSRGTVLNNQPFPELDFAIKFLDEGVLLENFNYQGGLSLSGYWDYGVVLTGKCKFENFDIYKLIKLITPLYSRYFNVASINGEASYFSYNATKLAKLSLELSEGRIWDVVFDSGRIELIGNSKILEFVDSELVIDGESLMFEGYMDISKFPDADMWKDVFLVPGSSSLLWNKADFEDSFGGRKLSLGANLKENVKLDYNVEFSDQENYNKNEISLKIIGKQNLKLRLREDEEIMGIEKTIEF
ncbi:MAG: hypothetical protein P9M06_02355 [Candidatus Saelkia tenebricola]|nr:hypothetical protein [Candidatus Saelkia tenebricola]